MSARDEQMVARTEAQLIALARRRGYRNPEWWAKNIIVGRRRKAALKTKLTYGGKPV